VFNPADYDKGNTSGEKAYTQKEIRLFRENYADMRQKVIVELLLDTGMRRADLARLQWDWFNLEEGYVVFPEKKKGNAPHKAFIRPQTTQLLRMFQGHRQTNKTYVFDGSCKKKYGRGHRSGRSLYNDVKELCKKSGVEPRGIHAMRATAVKTMQKRGWPASVAAKQINDNLETVQKYYAVPSEAEMQEHFNNGY
jgi:integrase